MKKKRPSGSSSAPASEYGFDEVAADRACRFIESALRHWQGEFAGRPFHLEPWERQIVRDVFGWKRTADGLRRYREVYIEVPKKNGKSPFAAAIALLLLFCDAEPGAEIYVVANDRSQAKELVFTDAQRMVQQNRYLSARSLVLANRIVFPEQASFLMPLSSKLETKHGQRPHAIIFDELHEFKSREIVEFLQRGTAARRQPLVISITTAGVGQESICWEKHDYARKVIAWQQGDHEAGIRDDAFYGVIYAAGPTDDWTQPEVWKRANPNLGVTVKLDYLETECRRALHNPAQQNSFRRLHLNQWVGQYERAIDMRLWDACSEAPQLDRLAGRRCFAGMDLSSKLDLTALVLLFPDEDGSYDLLPFFWIPRDNLLERVRRDRAPYDLWLESGDVFATEGNWVDQQAIRIQLQKLQQLYDIAEIAFDPMYATKIVTELQNDDGFAVVSVKPCYTTLSEPTKALLGLVADRKLRHGGNRPLRWQADALSIRKAPSDAWMPCKKKSTQRIDGVVATVMALGRAMVYQEQRLQLYVCD